ncbi:hypothetical protein [Aminipila luticellarii]|uniref:DUF551 domain-containing protein n=1 Tax=Aminipila luticellarii TaxID=2507160 RepID=A0A410PX44_9FIRM|nr:hypothetical protein [Aminipila luticellarii]QAT43456.1 hypothetical protein EQM06_09635 [Aminipila luticellarii]
MIDKIIERLEAEYIPEIEDEYDVGRNRGIDKAIQIVKQVAAEGGWIPFKLEYDEEEQTERLQAPLPDDEQEILVTDGKTTWQDTFLRDDGCYLDSRFELVSQVIAWQPLPEPFKEDTQP